MAFESLASKGLGIIQAVEAVLANFYVKTIAETDEIFIYEHGRYVGGIEWKLKQFMEELNPDASNYFINEVFGKLRRRTAVPLKNFDSDPCQINLENCLVDLKTGTVVRHSPKILLTRQLLVKHDPLAHSRAFEKFMLRVLPNNDDRIRVIDLWASCLWRVGLKKNLMLVGPTDTGKSTVLELIRRFLGDENVSSVSLQELDNDRFAAADLYQKLANIHPDLDKQSLKKSTRFKSSSGKRDQIRAQRKYGQPFHFVPFAKNFYSANQIPPTDDDSDAFYNRWQIVKCSQRFIDRDQAEQYRDDKDRLSLPEGCHMKDENIVDRLLTPRGKSAILNTLLERARKVIASGAIPNASTPEETRQTWLFDSDFILQFLESRVEFDATMEIPREPLYQEYTQWSKQRKITPASHTEFNRRAEKFGGTKENAKPEGRSGKSVAVWRGIKYKAGSSQKPVESIEPKRNRRSTSSIVLAPKIQPLTEDVLTAFRLWYLQTRDEPIECYHCDRIYDSVLAYQAHLEFAGIATAGVGK